MTNEPAERPWFDPDRLREQEALETAAARAGTFDGSGDFGTYWAYARGQGRGWARRHGLTGVWSARRYAADVCSLAGVHRRVDSVCDVGSGLGFITDALRRACAARRAVGVELATEAVSFARDRFPRCAFELRGIRPGDDLGVRFDCVHVKSFYPFTRSADHAIHRGYLEFCVRHLLPSGVLLLVVTEKVDEPGILQSLASGAVDPSTLGLSPFETRSLALTQLRNTLPLAVARPATHLVHGLLASGRPRMLVLSARRLP